MCFFWWLIRVTDDDFWRYLLFLIWLLFGVVFVKINFFLDLWEFSILTILFLSLELSNLLSRLWSNLLLFLLFFLCFCYIPINVSLCWLCCIIYKSECFFILDDFFSLCLFDLSEVVMKFISSLGQLLDLVDFYLC